ncbi:MAG: ubiquinone/menaquinone biosynthesis C-methylase UbiE [Planctomycetota bacterium]|jgi:ubiquinone/menaquinone biosynthesis C-methylase UbiE
MSSSGSFEKGVDFGRTASDYGRYRQGLPEDFFERLRTRGIGGPDQRILDLGSGTGQMARGLALGGATVTALDRSPDLLVAARELDRKSGVSVSQVVAPAEATTLPDDSFDVVTAAQCWLWFDKSRLGPELNRVFGPNGQLVIAQLDWLPWEDNVMNNSG